MLLGEEVRSAARRARRVHVLRRRIDDIARALRVDPGFVPSDQSGVDRLHAFRLLAASEVQAYVDDLATLVLDKVQDRSAQEGVLTHAGHHLLVYYSLEPLRSAASAPNAVYPSFTATQACADHAQSRSRLDAALTRHRRAARENSAVKGGSVKRLLLPFGYREAMLAPPLLSQLDSLAESRNQVAHHTGLVGASSWPSGSAEWSRLNTILPGLALLERYVPRLLRAADS